MKLDLESIGGLAVLMGGLWLLGAVVEGIMTVFGG